MLFLKRKQQRRKRVTFWIAWSEKWDGKDQRGRKDFKAEEMAIAKALRQDWAWCV